MAPKARYCPESFAHFSCDGFGVLVLVERLHVQVFTCGPFCSCDVPWPGRRQAEATFTVRESTNYPGLSSDFLHDTLQQIIGSDFAPVTICKSI